MFLHQALIFDCDGVLADTERDGHRPSFNAAFSAKGIDCVWDVDLYGHLLETVSFALCMLLQELCDLLL
jgi:beta-phosphoglucomutase-like phosphatase (HAD superfamily)